MNDGPDTRETVLGLGYWGWAALFIAAMAAAATANILDLVPDRARLWIMFAPLVLVPPMARAQMLRLGGKGVASPALTRYNRRLLAFIGIYMIVFLASVHAYDHYHLTGGAALAAAVLSVLPIMGAIWSMARYLHEEDDEYLRQRAVKAALFGLLLVLVLGSFWGFLETFGVVPHIWNWWVLPVWCIGLGIGSWWQGMRER